jgi:DNA-binding NtrC family response regulator
MRHDPDPHRHPGAAMSDAPTRLLVADDDPDVLAALRLLLRDEGYEIETATSPALVLHALEQRDVDLVLLDMNYTRDTTSGGEGLDLLERLRAHDATLPVIVMTAWGSVEGAVAAVRRGARDYVQKPWDNDRLLQTLRTQLELRRALRAGARLEHENRALRDPGAPELVAESPAMKALVDQVRRVAASDAPALVTGEHGTGKERLARALHAASPRAHRPFLVFDAGRVAASAFEGELFGQGRGAGRTPAEAPGRFELADGGTLLVDDVADVPADQQPRLLRALRSGEFERAGDPRTRQASVRVVGATTADLRAECAAGRFREDLLFGLNAVELRLPPLRERREDVPALAAFFLERFSRRYRRPFAGFADTALHALLSHAWPGNVRELEHALERAVLVAKGPVLEVTDLGLRPAAANAPPLEQMTLDEVERLLIQRALDRHAGNVSEAAKALGLSRSALYRRLERHGIRAAGA